MIVLVGLYVCSNGETERLTAHGSADHLNREVRGALERRTSAKLDNLGTALGHVGLHLLPFSLGEFCSADNIGQLTAGNLNVASEYCHLLTMTAIGGATGDFILHHIELLGQCALQTGRVKTGESCNLSGFQSRIE